MPFRETQLGRFGSLGVNLLNGPYDPDQMIAHLYASNGNTLYKQTGSPRPTVDETLMTKGIWDHASTIWRNWQQVFDTNRTRYVGYTHPLHALCTTPQQRAPGQCWHELIPPVQHLNLRGFTRHILPHLSMNNVAQDPQGNWHIPKHTRPLWNFVITMAGDILLYEELDQFSVIKHSSLSGGEPVWSAGKVGIESSLIRLVDLDSGHFIKQPGWHLTSLAPRLVAFTKAVFQDYAAGLLSGIPCLHANFDCTL